MVIATGATCALLFGGAGVAVAQSGWSWERGYLDPAPTASSTPEDAALFVYPYTAPSGAACELRVSGHLPASDPLGDALLRRAGSDGELKDRVDRQAASAFAEALASIARGDADLPSPTPQPQTSDAKDFAYFQALTQATFDAMAAVLTENGHAVPDFSRGVDPETEGSWSTGGNCAGAGE